MHKIFPVIILACSNLLVAMSSSESNYHCIVDATSDSLEVRISIAEDSMSRTYWATFINEGVSGEKQICQGNFANHTIDLNCGGIEIAMRSSPRDSTISFFSGEPQPMTCAALVDMR